MKRRTRRSRSNFILDNSTYQRLHLYIYLATVLFIFIMYLIAVSLFEDSPAAAIIGFISFLIGVGMIFYRGRIAEHISKKMHEKKVNSYKRANKVGLQQTIKRIVPKKSNVKLKIKGKVTMKERLAKAKITFQKKDPKKKGPEYIELE